MREGNEKSGAVAAAAAKIIAAAGDGPHARQEAVLVTQAIYAVQRGATTNLPLTDSDRFKRRHLAHVAGTVLYDPALDPADVVGAVVRMSRSSATGPASTTAETHARAV